MKYKYKRELIGVRIDSQTLEKLNKMSFCNEMSKQDCIIKLINDSYTENYDILYKEFLKSRKTLLG